MPTANVLCGVDFSKHSARALRYAAALAGRVGGSVTTVFVNDPLLDAAVSIAHDARKVAAQNDRELQRFVKGALGAARVAVDRLIVAGEPADEIRRIARERHYGFIVVGTQGLRGSRHMFFGSTTEQLLRITEVPLLAIPPRAPGKPHSNWPRPVVGCAVDLDAHLRDDVRTAAHYARMFGAKLTVMHAVKSASTPAWLRARREADPRLKSAETEVVSATRNPDIAPAPDVRILAGSPAEAVASFAKREVRLVILKLRRGTGLLGSRPGTITYQLLTISTVPVLALPSTPGIE